MLLDLLSLRANGVTTGQAGGYFLAREASLKRGIEGCRPACRNDFFAKIGRGVHWLADILARRAAAADGFQYFLAEAARSNRECTLDFLGLDYYDPFLAHVLRRPDFSDQEFPSASLYGRLMSGLSSKTWDWHILPEGLHAFCKYYAGAFPGLGILIAENGMAQRSKADNKACERRRDHMLRSDFLGTHLREVRRILDDDIPLLGYLHWSLTDNYEWGSFTPRFGLYRVDYANGLARLAEDHLGDNPSKTYARMIRELRLGRPADQ